MSFYKIIIKFILKNYSCRIVYMYPKKNYVFLIKNLYILYFMRIYDYFYKIEEM